MEQGRLKYGEDYCMDCKRGIEKFKLNFLRWVNGSKAPLKKQFFDYLWPYVWTGTARIKFVSFTW